MQVYGSGSDTINDVASATGIAQLPNSLLIFECSVQGKWYAEGTGCGYGSREVVRLAAAGALLLGCTSLSACTAAATAALNIAGTIAVKAFDLDTAIIENIKARKDAAADPAMSGGRGEASGSPGGRGEAFGAPGALPEGPSR